MVLGLIQNVIADKIGIDKPKDIGMDFSFVEDKRMDEEDFFTMLEEIEVELQMELTDHAWKFETVKHLVDFINRHQ